MTVANDKHEDPIRQPRRRALELLCTADAGLASVADALRQHIEQAGLKKIITDISSVLYEELNELDGVLVSFTGMVQDTSFPHELYHPLFKDPDTQHIMCGLYSDEMFEVSVELETTLQQHQMQHLTSTFMEKAPIYVVSTPGTGTPSHLQHPISAATAAKYPKILVNTSDQQQPTVQVGHQSVIAKLYDTDKMPKVGEQITLYGVLDMINDCRDTEADSRLASIATTSPIAVIDADLLPASVPRLHVLWYQSTPLHNDSFKTTTLRTDIKDTLLTYLTDILGGDSLCADHTRTGDWTLGAMPLSIVNCPPTLSVQLVAALQPIVHALAYIPVSLDYLNTTSLSPRSGETGQSESTLGLCAGSLQLVSGTQVIVDELVLAQGTLNERALDNLQVLRTLVDNHRLIYHFPFTSIGIPIDLNVLFISDSRLLTPVNTATAVVLSDDAHKVLYKRHSGIVPQLPYLDATEMQTYISCARIALCELDKTSAKLVEDTFVQERQAAHSAGTPLPGQEELSARITLARLYGQLIGEQSVSIANWQHVCEMEQDRLKRLQVWSSSKKMVANMANIQV